MPATWLFLARVPLPLSLRCNYPGGVAERERADFSNVAVQITLVGLEMPLSPGTSSLQRTWGRVHLLMRFLHLSFGHRL